MAVTEIGQEQRMGAVSGMVQLLSQGIARRQWRCLAAC